MKRVLLYSAAAIALVAGAACSKSDDSAAADGGAAQAQAQTQIAAQSSAAFLNPETPLGTIASSITGVSTWNLYSGPSGTVAIANDPNCDSGAAQYCPAVAELAVVTDAAGNVTGAAYAIANTLGITGAQLAAGLNADLQAAASGTTAKDLRIQGLFGNDDGGSLVSTGATLVISCAKSLVSGFAAAAVAMFKSPSTTAACPSNVPAPCDGGTVSGTNATPAPSVANSCGGKGNVDQAAIGETTNGLLAPPFTSTLSDAYNIEDPFAIDPSAYADTMTQRLMGFDAVDGTTDWTNDQISNWVGRMSTSNYVILDTSMPCDYANPHTYLELERAQLTGGTHATCGGRMPNELVIDVILNFMVRGPGASVNDANAISDGLTGATQPSTATFPYLADLNSVESML